MATSDRSTGLTSSPSTSCAAATRASPSLTRDRVRAAMIRAISGQRLPDAFASFDPDGCCWRTSQATFLSGSDLFSETWPRSGTMRGGTAYPLPPLAPRTYAIACSSWRGDLMATPTTVANQLSPSMMKHPGCRAIAGLLPTPTTVDTRTSPRTGPIEQTSTGTLRTRTADGRSAVLSLADLAMRGATGTPGRLSPLFVEWMMGFPQHWTRLDSED